MADDLNEVLLQTLDMLEWRLRRIEFVLNGNVPPERQQADAPVASRLQKLESRLSSLAGSSRTISEILQLQSKHADIFAPTEQPARALPSSMDDPTPEIKLGTILTEAPAYPATASQLTSLHDLPLPPTESFTSLVALSPRIAQLEQNQLAQAHDISDLRKRSGKAVLRWHEVMVLGQGRCWAEWDSRVRKAERDVRREEVKIEREAGAV
ncbi:nuclear distribution protein RO10, putative [Macrophomina phaseolina MS6]|uniref:Nuclear distribution protein RO10, putative n=2 Tax=Macrophomina phaseolina TaxID=35725 RepID=K2RQI5_MACPH|nr:nuclear distribution protein RO10, putative [Macrophomina phaseolina MS6]KAH7063216.1 putative nuclear distribution protein RO10 [Macrophomina phaseolina]